MKYSKQLLKEFAKELAIFFLLATFIALLWRDNLTLSSVVLAECLLTLGLWHNRYDLCFFLVAAVLGSIAEVVWVYFEVWKYSNPTFLGVPLWFPIAFGTCGLIGERLVRTITLMWDEASSLHVSKK